MSQVFLGKQEKEEGDPQNGRNYKRRLLGGKTLLVCDHHLLCSFTLIFTHAMGRI